MRRIARGLARRAFTAPPAALPSQLARVPPWAWTPQGAAAWSRWLSGAAADAAPPPREDAPLAPSEDPLPSRPTGRPRNALGRFVSPTPEELERHRVQPSFPPQPVDPRSVAFLVAKGVGTEDEVHALLARARGRAHLGSTPRSTFSLEGTAGVYAFFERISGDATHTKRGSDKRIPLAVLMVQVRGATRLGLACVAAADRALLRLRSRSAHLCC
jgi:hypothetical protein